jgi:oxalyl-CoA decarboxylase
MIKSWRGLLARLRLCRAAPTEVESLPAPLASAGPVRTASKGTRAIFYESRHAPGKDIAMNDTVTKARHATTTAASPAEDAPKIASGEIASGEINAQSPETDGFQLVIDALKLNGIDTIFGLPGIPITDLTRKVQAAGIRIISFRHEQNAGYAASIAGFMTQKPGICLTVSAPGFLNGLTALANATTNCFPMILISGSSEREIVDLQQGDYEEMDQLAIARPHAKAAFRVLHAEDIGVGVARAIRAALSGRPGGVYLDLPAKLFPQTIDAEAGRQSLIKVVDPAPRQIPAPDAVQRALDLLRSAKRPLIILGKGAAYARADADIRALVEKTSIPYLPMAMAKGLLPDTHEQSAAAARSYVLPEADVVLVIGARLNWLLSHGKGKTWGGNSAKDWGGQKFIQIDISPQEADSNVRIDAPVVGDIGSCVSAMLGAMGSNWPKPPAEWLDAIAERKTKNIAKMGELLAKNPTPMNFHSALNVVRDIVKANPDAILVNEGANALDFTRSIVDMHKPRKRLDVGTWGVMGIGMGFSVAAAVVSGEQVIAVEGDSAFGFSGMEVETICRYNLPVCVVILNNNGVYRGDEVNPTGGGDPSPLVFVKGARYEKLMEAFGGVGVMASTPAELRNAMEEAIRSRKPTLINAVIDEKAGTESGRITSLNPAAKKNP